MIESVFSLPSPDRQALYLSAFIIAAFLRRLGRHGDILPILYLLTAFMMSDEIYFAALTVWLLTIWLFDAVFTLITGNEE